MLATCLPKASACCAVVATVKVPPLAKWQSMSLGLAHPADFVHGVLHRMQEGEPRGRVGCLETLIDPHGHAHAPAAITSTRAETDGLGFEHRDVEVRAMTAQVVGRPQSGKTAAHDGDIRSRRQSGGRSRLRRLVQRVEPEAAVVVRGERPRSRPGTDATVGVVVNHQRCHPRWSTVSHDRDDRDIVVLGLLSSPLQSNAGHEARVPRRSVSPVRGRPRPHSVRARRSFRGSSRYHGSL